jgi:hypothetical protein
VVEFTLVKYANDATPLYKHGNHINVNTSNYCATSFETLHCYGPWYVNGK